jgi:anti-sigma factor ChrR (cupin superfamily)
MFRINHEVDSLGRYMVFTHDMSDWLSFNIDRDWLDKNISWRDFETGVKLGKLKREEKISLVLYEANSEVTVDAFMPHMHPGGEAYIVLEGEVWDEDGTYPTGSIVWMNRETTHTPKTRGKTLILVLWPEGVKSA